MKKAYRGLLVLALLAAPAPLLAQGGARPPAGRDAPSAPGPEARPFLDFFLRHRAELGITDAQMARLETIGQRLEEQNRPVRERLRETRRRFVEERRAQMQRLAPEARRDTLRKLRREGRREVPQEMRALAEQIRENTHRASDEVRDVLTAEQKERARVLMRARRQEMRERAREFRRPPGRPAPRPGRRPEARPPVPGL